MRIFLHRKSYRIYRQNTTVTQFSKFLDTRLQYKNQQCYYTQGITDEGGRRKNVKNKTIKIFRENKKISMTSGEGRSFKQVTNATDLKQKTGKFDYTEIKT